MAVTSKTKQTAADFSKDELSAILKYGAQNMYVGISGVLYAGLLIIGLQQVQG
jgi:hypothetical protein